MGNGYWGTKGAPGLVCGGRAGLVAAGPGFGAGVRVAWDGGRVASGPGWFPPCNQGEILEVWQPASTIITAVSHASAQKRQR